MSQVSKNELIYDNSVSFPNNNAGAITPADLRNFNVDLIDSTVNQTIYTADSASLYWKIVDTNTIIDTLLITASVDGDTLTFTKENGSSFNLVITASNATIPWDNISSKPSGLVSGSSQVVSILNPLNAFSASQITKDSTLATYTGSVDTKFTTIGSQSGSWLNTALNTFTASQEGKDITLGTYTGSVDSKFATIGVYTGSNDTKWNNLGNQSGSFVTESETGSFARVNVSNTFTTDQTIQGTLNVTTLNATTINTIIESSSVIFSSGSNILGDSTSDTQTLNGTILVSGSQQVTGSVGISGNTTITGSINLNGNQNIVGQLTASRLQVTANTSLGGTLSVSNDTQMSGDLTIQSTSPQIKLRDTGGGGFSSGYDVRVDTGSFEIYDDTHNRDVLSDFFNSGSGKHTTSLTSEIIIISGSDSVTILGNSTTLGNSTIVGNQTITGSLLISSSAIVELNVVGNTTMTGSLIVSGSTLVTGSVRGNVVTQGIASNTASLDFGNSNFFELSLVSGSNTRVEATNVRPGQTVSLKVTQAAVVGGTITFSPQFDFPSISPFTATQSGSAVDVLTFVVFSNTGSIYSAGVNNLR